MFSNHLLKKGSKGKLVDLDDALGPIIQAYTNRDNKVLDYMVSNKPLTLV